MNFTITEVRLSAYKDAERTVQEIERFFKEGVEKNRKRFKNPEDDWLPVYLAVLPDGKGALFSGSIDKHLFVQTVASFVEYFGAVGVGQLYSSWRYMGDPNNRPEGSIAGKPGSEEGLLLAVYSRTNWQMEWAKIKRDGKNPPTLDAWEVMMKREKDVEVSGMMFDPLFQALRKN